MENPVETTPDAETSEATTPSGATGPDATSSDGTPTMSTPSPEPEGDAAEVDKRRAHCRPAEVDIVPFGRGLVVAHLHADHREVAVALEADRATACRLVAHKGRVLHY